MTAITNKIQNPKQIVEMGPVRVFIYFYHNIANIGRGHFYTTPKEFVAYVHIGDRKRSRVSW